MSRWVAGSLFRCDYWNVIGYPENRRYYFDHDQAPRTQAVQSLDMYNDIFEIQSDPNVEAIEWLLNSGADLIMIFLYPVSKMRGP